MRAIFSAVTGVAAAAAISLTGLAQAPAQSSSQSQSPPGATGQEQQITVVGCVQRESDYRRSKDAGRGGVAGTGLGAGNEYVLVNARVSRGGVSDPSFELTGANEGKAGSYVGKQVEIIGKLKPTEVGAGGRPTGGPTADAPPAGVDVASKDLKLRELEVSSVKEASGAASATCPAA